MMNKKPQDVKGDERVLMEMQRHRFGIANDGDVYKTIELDAGGINYRDFIKIRFQTINEGRFRQMGKGAWHILLYLLAFADKGTFIRTSAGMIEDQIDVKKVVGTLEKLEEQGYIKIYRTGEDGTKIHRNESLDILILYNEDKLSPDHKNGYKAIPREYLKYLLIKLRLSSDELAIFSVLFVRFRWFIFTEVLDYQTGEIVTYPKELAYAFPQQREIYKLTGIARNRVKGIIDSLASTGVISYGENPAKVEQDDKSIYSANYVYKVKLLQRVEYVYYHLLEVPDHRPAQIQEQISTLGFINYLNKYDETCLSDRDYLSYTYSVKIDHFRGEIQKTRKSAEYHSDYYYDESSLPYQASDTIDCMAYMVGKIDEFKNRSIQQNRKLRKQKERQVAAWETSV